MRFEFRYFVIAAVAWLMALGGCGGDPLGRHAVSGTIKVDGSPLAKGNVAFQPTEGQATSGGAVIQNGKYAVPQAGGLVAGKYRVSIHAPAPGTGGEVDAESLPGDPPRPPRELIPPDWNTASTQTIEVRKQGPFVFDFDVSTKAGSAKAKQ